MTERVYNFAAGPAVLPLPVLEQAQRELVALPEIGMSVLEMSHRFRTQELAYYLVYAPVGWPVEEVVQAAGARWTIEEMFKLAKGQVGLNHYEARSWQGWHRHITLALVALAALAVGSAKRGRFLAQSTSPSLSQKSADSWSASCGPPANLQHKSWAGPAGAASTRRQLNYATAVAA